MKKVQIKDYNVFADKQKVSLKQIKKVIANIMIYASLYSSIFLLGGELKLQNNADLINTDVKIESFDDRDQYLNELKDSTDINIDNKDNQIIFHAVLNNNKLIESEKRNFYNLSDLVSDNPNIDELNVYNVLRNIDIVYAERPNEYDKSIRAIYSYKDNVIYIFDKEDEVNLKIIFHELIHSIYTNENTIKLPKYLIEGTTEILTDEYFSSQPFVEKSTYPFEVIMVKLLCEMVGSDKVLKTYTTGDMNIIKDELNIICDVNEVNIFLENIEEIFNYHTNNEMIPSEIFNNFINFMNKYILKKSNNIETINRCSYYINALQFLNTDDSYGNYLGYIIDNGVYQYPYFSRELLEKSKNRNISTLSSAEEKILVK